jgi:glycerol-3-phosphate dehydrogenase
MKWFQGFAYSWKLRRYSVVVNATGPFTDGVRRMSDGAKKEIITPAGGVHVTLPGYFAPSHMGLIVPKTADGRVAGAYTRPLFGSTSALSVG